MKRTRLILAVLLALLWGAGTISVAQAEVLPQQEGTNAVGACLEADEVWLVVVDDEERVLANQCVGTPENGVAALEAAGVSVTTDPAGMICAVGGHPDPCPETFTGQYWGYYTTTAGEQWGYYEVGAQDSEPAPGTIEGWCYNQADEEFCNPPLLKVEIDGAVVVGEGVAEADLVDLDVTGSATPDEGPGETADESTAGGSLAPWIIVGVVLVVVIGAVIAVALRRRGDSAGGDLAGGR